MMATVPLNLVTILSSNAGEKCPACKRKTLVASDYVKVSGYPENIPWTCIKCPDEFNCGLARAT